MQEQCPTVFFFSRSHFVEVALRFIPGDRGEVDSKVNQRGALLWSRSADEQLGMW